ncbi:FAS1-like dehydratase domain-containing protein [Spiribacter halobius]|uniref:Acyl-CoA dehydrogenase n=1 Tax=Sediminicurvatus halobius TaxID=2182432 RepID=A0A2U2NA11_9GAMM|nr:MaoC family dehydratase N-terminal domain-containing protein [Spiribacter halobius]PWG65819.1 acyl-CoA dehydrogenase [Spiribacter halobius]UEX77862.1 MaoC family dehydratase N-terminal domain-containing protein [Spiribacter halobius]
MALDTAHLEQWIGRTESATEQLERWPVTALLAALDRPPEDWPATGDPIPPTAHWTYFVPRVRQSRIGADGHPERGDFLPPIPLPRRMWAGSRIRYLAPLTLGEDVTRTATVKSVTTKEGRSGLLAFVTVEYSYAGAAGPALVEEQDLVYRENPPADAPPPQPRPAPADAAWSREIHPDEPLLFRYSAVTFNAHRIHYDQPYTTEVEGYPGLIVHGQLIATFLLDAWRREHPERQLESFSFRAMSPLYCGAPFHAEGRPGEAEGESALWARTAEGGLAMQADVTWS